MLLTKLCHQHRCSLFTTNHLSDLSQVDSKATHVKTMTSKKKIVNETSDIRIETSKQGNDSGQTKTQQHVTANPYEIDSE